MAHIECDHDVHIKSPLHTWKMFTKEVVFDYCVRVLNGIYLTLVFGCANIAYTKEGLMMMTKKKIFGRKEGTEKVKGRVLIVENEDSKERIMNSENPSWTEIVLALMKLFESCYKKEGQCCQNKNWHISRRSQYIGCINVIDRALVGWASEIWH